VLILKSETNIYRSKDRLKELSLASNELLRTRQGERRMNLNSKRTFLRLKSSKKSLEMKREKFCSAKRDKYLQKAIFHVVIMTSASLHIIFGKESATNVLLTEPKTQNYHSHVTNLSAKPEKF